MGWYIVTLFAGAILAGGVIYLVGKARGRDLHYIEEAKRDAKASKRIGEAVADAPHTRDDLVDRLRDRSRKL